MKRVPDKTPVEFDDNNTEANGPTPKRGKVHSLL